MKIGVIDPGGGWRGIYAAGILDRWLDLRIEVSVAVGVSAGSANLASFLARQSMRNHTFYTVFGQRPEYMGMRNFLQKRSYLDLDYVYGTLSDGDGEYPLDYAQLRSNPAEFIVVATDAATGKAHYFEKSQLRQDCYDPFKASSAIPFVCRPYPIDGRFYYDGALSDPLPVDQAFARGCDRVVLFLTKPKQPAGPSKIDSFLAGRIRREYPQAAERMRHRYLTYNKALEKALALEKEGKLLIIAPDDTCGVKTLDRDVERLEALYNKGYSDSDKALPFLESAE